jgi:hypothetical protein
MEPSKDVGQFCHKGSSMSLVTGLYRTGLVLSVIVALPITASVAGTVAIGTKYIVYYDVTINRNWSDAESFAQNTFGTNLASVHSSSDLSEIESLISDVGAPVSQHVWTGGYEDPPDSESFHNLDGTVWDFANWRPGEPSFNEDCVGLGPFVFGDMGDFNCSLPVSTMVINKPNSAPGRVPGSGAPLLVTKNLAVPTNLDLSWGAACGDNTSHYGLYEGVLGAGHGSFLCGVTGTTVSNQTPSPGNTYYLVVPYSSADSEEGSYGTDSSGAERPRGSNPCQASQDLQTCE